MPAPDVADGVDGHKGSGSSRDGDAEWRISDPHFLEPVTRSDGNNMDSSSGEEESSQKRSGQRRGMPGDRSPIPGSTGSGKNFPAGSFTRSAIRRSLPEVLERTGSDKSDMSITNQYKEMLLSHHVDDDQRRTTPQGSSENLLQNMKEMHGSFRSRLSQAANAARLLATNSTKAPVVTNFTITNSKVSPEAIVRSNIARFYDSEFYESRCSGAVLMSFLKVAFLAARRVQGGALFSIPNALFIATSLVMALFPNVQLIHSHYDELGAIFIVMDLISLSWSWTHDSDTGLTTLILACIVVGLAQPLILHIRFKFIVTAALCYLLSVGPLFAIPLYDPRWFIIFGLVFVGLQSSSIQELTAMQLCKERVKLEREERRTGSLLAKMLPPVASHRLKAGEKHIASEHKEVTILFAEIEGMSEFVKTDESGRDDSRERAEAAVVLLNNVYKHFDLLMDQYKVFKVETVGEVYVAASGLPHACSDHAERCARVGLAMLEAIKQYSTPDGHPLQLKVGIHSGNIISGVIGLLLPRFRLFGDTINTASRMCSKNPAAGTVMCSRDTRDLIHTSFVMEDLGSLPIKGKGDMHCYHLGSEVMSNASFSVHLMEEDLLLYDVQMCVNNLSDTTHSSRLEAVKVAVSESAIIVERDEPNPWGGVQEQQQQPGSNSKNQRRLSTISITDAVQAVSEAFGRSVSAVTPKQSTPGSNSGGGEGGHFPSQDSASFRRSSPSRSPERAVSADFDAGSRGGGFVVSAHRQLNSQFNSSSNSSWRKSQEEGCSGNPGSPPPTSHASLETWTGSGRTQSDPVDSFDSKFDSRRTSSGSHCMSSSPIPSVSASRKASILASQSMDSNPPVRRRWNLSVLIPPAFETSCLMSGTPIDEDASMDSSSFPFPITSPILHQDVPSEPPAIPDTMPPLYYGAPAAAFARSPPPFALTPRHKRKSISWSHPSRQNPMTPPPERGSGPKSTPLPFPSHPAESNQSAETSSSSILSSEPRSPECLPPLSRSQSSPEASYWNASGPPSPIFRSQSSPVAPTSTSPALSVSSIRSQRYMLRSPPTRSRRASIFDAFMGPPVSTMPSSLLQLPVILSANKFAIPIDKIIKITHSMNRSKLEIIIADGNDASGQRLVELLFELSWLKHEFLAGLTSYLSPEVIVDDLLVPQSVKEIISRERVRSSKSLAQGIQTTDSPMGNKTQRQEMYEILQQQGERKRLTMSPLRRGESQDFADKDPKRGRMFMLGERFRKDGPNLDASSASVSTEADESGSFDFSTSASQIRSIHVRGAPLLSSSTGSLSLESTKQPSFKGGGGDSFTRRQNALLSRQDSKPRNLRRSNSFQNGVASESRSPMPSMRVSSSRDARPTSQFGSSARSGSRRNSVCVMPAIPATPMYGDGDESNTEAATDDYPAMKRHDSRDDWVIRKPVDTLSASEKQGDSVFSSPINEKRNNNEKKDILRLHSRRASLPSLHIQVGTDTASDLVSGFSVSDRNVCGAGCPTAPVHKSEREDKRSAASSNFNSVPLKAWSDLPRKGSSITGTPITKPSCISKSHHSRLSESFEQSSAGSTPKSTSSRKNVMIKEATTGGKRRALSRSNSDDSHLSDSSSSLSDMVSAVINVSTKFVMKKFSASRRSSIPVVEPFSRSKAWKLSKSTVWKSSFALVKDEAHATRWDEIMNMVRSGLTADPEIIEQVNLQFAERFRPAFCGFSFFFLSIFTLQATISGTCHQDVCPAVDLVHLHNTAWGYLRVFVQIFGFSISLAATIATLPPVWVRIVGPDDMWGSFIPAVVSTQVSMVVLALTLSTLTTPFGHHTASFFFPGANAESSSFALCFFGAVLCTVVPALRLVHAYVVVVIIILNSLALLAMAPSDAPLVSIITLAAAVCGMKVTVEQDSMLSVHFVKTTLVRDEISRSMTIIRNLLPRHVIQQLVHDPTMDRFKGNAPPCDEFESVSILFADIVGFTAMSAQTTPQQLVDMLNSIFSVFDALAVKHSVYKVETIGDCYFCASGLPIEDKFHADNIIRMALDMQEAAKNFQTPLGATLQFRIGIHSGPVVAGVVGSKMPRYHLFGESVRKASSMESTGQAGRIKVSFETLCLVTESFKATVTDQDGTVLPMIFTEEEDNP